eukprot:15470569-Alexandrium_andersonii.AAC.1
MRGLQDARFRARMDATDACFAGADASSPMFPEGACQGTEVQSGCAGHACLANALYVQYS